MKPPLVKPNGTDLNWEDRQNWDTLPLDTFAVLRIKAYAAPWHPEFTLKRADYSFKTTGLEWRGYTWQSQIMFGDGATKSNVGTVDLAVETFSELDLKELVLIQLSRSSAPNNEKTKMKSPPSIAALIVCRRRNWWERVGIASLDSVRIFESHCKEMEFELA
jgi:hypothetical protein